MLRIIVNGSLEVDFQGKKFLKKKHYFFFLQLSRVDCREALEMICNLEADGDEKAAFTLCSGFLTRQILQEDSYCAW